MPLNPWDFQRISFTDAALDAGSPGGSRWEGAGGEVIRAGMLATCGHCRTEVVVPVDQVRPALRLGLSILDSGPEAREVGAEAGAALDRVGGSRLLLEGLAGIGAPLGELGRVERVALGIALDARAEADALVTEWREAEEITAIMDADLTDVAGFLAFRERVLGEGSGG
jgi:hypothetical protein